MEINITNQEIEELAEKLNIENKHIPKNKLVKFTIDHSSDINNIFRSLIDTNKYNSIIDYAIYRANQNFKSSGINGVVAATKDFVYETYFMIIQKFKNFGYLIEE